MDVRIKFLGGAGTVTGSRYLIETDDYQVMIDCGLFQGLKKLRLRNWDKLPVDISKIDAVVLTHAHIDHSGYLPRLVREGFQGKIYCTDATAALLEIMLTDAGRLQEEEAEFAWKKGYSKHARPQPLFSEEDARCVFPLLVPVRFGEQISISSSISIRYYHAGHILGAGSVDLIVKGEEQEKHIVFSGDLGPYDSPLHFAPEKMGFADVLLVESTYGDRNREGEDVLTRLRDTIHRVEDRNGCLLIPAFSVGRTQLILYYLWKLYSEDMVERWPVYIDSPMAISVTNLYRKFSDYHRLHDAEGNENIFDAPFFNYIRDQRESRLLNEIRHRAIIISASGMCTGGRILHHLFHRLPRQQDTVLLTGYQAEGSRGRSMADGEKMIRMFGEEVPVHATIEEIAGLSAHADKAELLHWLDSFVSAPKMTFVVHGEQQSAQSLKNDLHNRNWNAFVPEYLENFHLFQGI